MIGRYHAGVLTGALSFNSPIPFKAPFMARKGNSAAPAAGVNAAAPIAKDGGLDANKIEFKLKIEVKGNIANKLQRVISDLNWTASPSPGDCSHRNDGGSSGSYTTLMGPMTSVDKGGLDNLAQLIERLRQNGYDKDFGHTASMHVWVSDKCLGDEGVTNLVNLHLANEALIYRLAQAGGAGRDIKEKMVYTTPLSCNSWYTNYNGASAFTDGYFQMAANLRGLQNLQSVASWKTTLNHYHRCMNGSQSGMWQFRYFDPTPDTAGMQNSIKMLLGMIKGSADGRVKADQVRPLPETWDAKVTRKQWNAFMDAVAANDAGLRRDLEAQFIRCGGKLEKDQLSPAARDAVNRLLTDHRFEEHGGGGRYGSIEDFEKAINDGVTFSVHPPGNPPFALQGDRFAAYALAQTGAVDALDAETRSSLYATQQLAQRGVELLDTAGGQKLSPAAAAVLVSEPNRVSVRRGGENVTLADGNALSDYFEKTIYPERLAALTDAQRQNVALGEELCGKNCRLADEHGDALLPGRVRMLDAMSGVLNLRVTSPAGGTMALQSQDAFHNYALAELGRLDELSAPARDALQQVLELRTAGFELKNASQQAAGVGEVAAAGVGQSGFTAHSLSQQQWPVNGNLPQLAEELLAPLHQTSADDQAAGRALFQIAAHEQLPASVQGAPLSRMEQLPWLFAHHQNVAVGFQTLSSWNQVRRVVDCQNKPAAELGGHDGAVLLKLDQLRHQNVQIYGMKKQALPLRADQVDQLDREGLRVVLPRRPWWTFFRKKIKVKNEQKLEKLARRLGG